MPLTDAEKQTGREFRTAAQQELDRLNAAGPPSYMVPAFLSIFRHKCQGRNDRSTAMQLREVYWRSDAELPGWDNERTDRFAFVFREGRCGRCEATARSDKGRVVDTTERPPLEGRMARRG